MIGKFGDLDLTLPELVRLGYFPGAEPWGKFGAGTVTTSWSTIYSAGADPGLYQYLTEAKLIAVASTDVDDAFTGTGCKFVTIEGEDANMNFQSETIQTDGQTPVSSTKEFLRVTRVENKSDQDCQGQLYVGAADDTWVGGEPGTILGHINDGYNQSQMALYTVPKGFDLWVYNATFSSANKEGEIGLYVRSHGFLSIPKTVFANKVPYEIGGFLPVNVQRVPFVIPEGTEFEIRGKATTGSMRVTVNMSGVLMPTKYRP